MSGTVPSDHNYWSVLFRETTPELRSPNKILHSELKRGKWYYIIKRSDLIHPIADTDKRIGKITRVPRTINYAIDSPEYWELTHDGQVDRLGSEIDQYDEVYLCKNKLCQDSGTGHPEQSGGAKRKRYPITRKKRNMKKVRKSRIRRN